MTSKVDGASCTEAGTITYTATFTEDWAETQTKTVAGQTATGHTYGEVTYTWNANNSACTATHTCTCGHSETATATVTSKTDAPTCTEAGTVTYTATFAEAWAATQTKTVAGEAATGHSYGAVTYTWNANNSACTATHSCACGHSETATATVTSKTDAPSCTEVGTVTYTATFTEDWAETQTKAVAGGAATGHNYGEVTYTWSADNSACTATHSCACGHSETATATVTSKTDAPTCTEAGTVTYTATFAEAWAVTQTNTVAGEAATGHNTDGTVAHKDAACTEDGVVGGNYCTVCNHGKAEAEAVIPATGHVDADNNEVCENCNADLTNAKTGDTVLAVIAAAVISLLSIVALPVIKKRL